MKITGECVEVCLIENLDEIAFFNEIMKRWNFYYWFLSFKLENWERRRIYYLLKKLLLVFSHYICILLIELLRNYSIIDKWFKSQTATYKLISSFLISLGISQFSKVWLKMMNFEKCPTNSHFQLFFVSPKLKPSTNII